MKRWFFKIAYNYYIEECLCDLNNINMLNDKIINICNEKFIYLNNGTNVKFQMVR